MLTERVRLRFSARSFALSALSGAGAPGSRAAWDLAVCILPALVSAFISMAMRRSSGYKRLQQGEKIHVNCHTHCIMLPAVIGMLTPGWSVVAVQYVMRQ